MHTWTTFIRKRVRWKVVHSFKHSQPKWGRISNSHQRRTLRQGQFPKMAVLCKRETLSLFMDRRVLSHQLMATTRARMLTLSPEVPSPPHRAGRRTSIVLWSRAEVTSFSYTRTHIHRQICHHYHQIRHLNYIRQNLYQIINWGWSNSCHRAPATRCSSSRSSSATLCTAKVLRIPEELHRSS